MFWCIVSYIFEIEENEISTTSNFSNRSAFSLKTKKTMVLQWNDVLNCNAIVFLIFSEKTDLFPTNDGKNHDRVANKDPINFLDSRKSLSSCLNVYSIVNKFWNIHLILKNEILCRFYFLISNKCLKMFTLLSRRLDRLENDFLKSRKLNGSLLAALSYIFTQLLIIFLLPLSHG
jgi:hypothetical protein